MDLYVTGTIIKRLREEKGITQAELAQRLGVTDKAISKWETAKGFPDISLIEPLSAALGVSVLERMSGEPVCNQNRAGNMAKVKFYVCPICGNVIQSTGGAVISCCGLTLPALEAEDPDDAHRISAERVEDEYFLTAAHDMTKQHYISFIAYVTADQIRFVKLYPEGNAETRLPLRGRGVLYWYCNRHGLMKQRF